MQRIFIEQPNDSNLINLDASHPSFQHLTRSMRVKPDDQLEVVRQKTVYLAEVVAVDKQNLQLKLLNELATVDSELPVDVTIIVSPLKNDRSEWLVQKATELGVKQIVFVQMKHSVVDWQRNSVKKIERMQAVARSAAEQSHRRIIPQITWHALDQQMSYLPQADLQLVAWEESAKAGEQTALIKALQTIDPEQTMSIYFGPEGGIHPDEIAQLKTKGFLPVGLGPRILRAETAPLFALSAISTIKELS